MNLKEILEAHVMLHLQIAITATDALNKSLISLYEEFEKPNAKGESN